MKTSDASNSRSLAQHIEKFGRAITAPELGALLSGHVVTIYRIAKTGRIPSYRIDSNLRFEETSLVRITPEFRNEHGLREVRQ
jgi:hypothetical protein